MRSSPPLFRRAEKVRHKEPKHNNEAIDCYSRKRSLQGLHGNTNGKVKRAAGVAFRQPIKGIVNNNGVLTSDNTQKVEILADHIQHSHQSEE